MSVFSRLARSIPIRVPLLSLIATTIPSVILGSRSTDDLASLSLAELLQVEITTVARQATQLSDAPAAVYVLRQEDIVRSGYTTIPDLLRLVPGLQVGQIDASRWSVTSRGFGGRFARNLLVLVDGRSVYTPLFSGVYWEVQDLMLEDIERIEVIRGPGATLWGSNAVNGVINIVTRDAQDTQGTFVQGSAGTEESGAVQARYGGALGPSAHYRVYGKFFDRTHTVSRTGTETHDGWDVVRGGFRGDWALRATDVLSFQGGIYGGSQGVHYGLPSTAAPYVEQVVDESRLEGGHLMATWDHTMSPSSDLALQVYFDRGIRSDDYWGALRTAFDVDFQHRFAVLPRAGLIWGAGYRHTDLRFLASRWVTVDSGGSDFGHGLASAFVQSEVKIVPRRLGVTIGGKVERQDRTSLQPNARILWTPSEVHTVWGSVSSPVRTPSESEHHISTWLQAIPPGTEKNPGTIPLLVYSVGDEGLKDERTVAWEGGYRVQPSATFFVDLALYHNELHDLRGAVPEDPIVRQSPEPVVILPLRLINVSNGTTNGAELATEWQPRPEIRLRTGYTWLNARNSHAGSSETSLFDEFASIPRHQVFVHGMFDVGRTIDLDAIVRYVDAIESLKTSAYTLLDLRIGWWARPTVELSAAGRNLGKIHTEFPFELDSYSSKIEPGFYAAVTYRP
ncbi:MAG: TonB-dependent receptor [Candidatus Eisenbacteria bacterium]|uniref:TonB-dependent receptor n=1 Tax=Eiseniibacteriota bacterium TaxID=2212470 RepID=A0A956LXB3_UNCEI|nr:TonB-dependent receptor [Candidatus Eisenbacteria bacterium]